MGDGKSLDGSRGAWGSWGRSRFNCAHPSCSRAAALVFILSIHRGSFTSCLSSLTMAFQPSFHICPNPFIPWIQRIISKFPVINGGYWWDMVPEQRGRKEKNRREVKEIHRRDGKKKRYELRREKWSKKEKK